MQINHFVTEAKELMQSALRCMMGAEMSQMSLLYFLTYVAAAGNLKNLVEGTPYTAQEYKIKVIAKLWISGTVDCKVSYFCIKA